MYEILYEWHLPELSRENELLQDFETIKKIAAQNGALTTHLFKSPEQNKFIGVEIWPSKEKYSSWFDQQTFTFQGNQPQEYVQLVNKIKNVYKNKFIGDITVSM